MKTVPARKGLKQLVKRAKARDDVIVMNYTLNSIKNMSYDVDHFTSKPFSCGSR